VALAADRLTAVVPNDAGAVWTRTITPPQAGQPWADLAAKLGELRTLVGSRRTLFVALMGTFGQLRLVELPGINEEEAARVVRRDPSRFFPMRSEPLVVEVEATTWRRRSPFIVAAAPPAEWEAIGAAAESSGWSLGGIAPAPLAWLARPSSPARSRELLIHLDSHVELLRARGHVLTSYRRLPPTAAPTPDVDVSDGVETIASESDAATVAARYVVRVVAPLLLPDNVRTAVRRSTRRAAYARFGVAAALLLLAAAVQLVGLRREQTRIAAERSRLRQAVVTSMAVRESIAVARQRLAVLRDAEARSPRWSELVAELAGTLPSDAFLLALRGDRDSLHVEGLASRAAPVLDALRAVSGVREVRADAPIRQVVHDDRATSERFVLSALLAGVSPVPDRGAPNVKRLPATGGEP